MSYEYYLKLKQRGVISNYLLNDIGIKIFPVCLNIRKFITKQQNHFVLLNVSFEIFLDIENYFSIGFDLFHYSHHQTHLTNEKQPTRLSIKKEPLYEFGNEEEFLPKIEMISILHNEQQILDLLKESIIVYEKEQNISIWTEFLICWNENKKNIPTKKNDPNISIGIWKNLFYLLKTYEKAKLLKGKTWA